MISSKWIDCTSPSFNCHAILLFTSFITEQSIPSPSIPRTPPPTCLPSTAAGRRRPRLPPILQPPSLPSHERAPASILLHTIQATILHHPAQTPALTRTATCITHNSSSNHPRTGRHNNINNNICIRRALVRTLLLTIAIRQGLRMGVWKLVVIPITTRSSNSTLACPPLPSQTECIVRTTISNETELLLWRQM